MSGLIAISHRLPTVAEHARLFERAGWPWYGAVATHRALAGSSFGAVAERTGEIVGMVRVVGDGSVFFYLQDLVVDPDVQRLGIGAALVRTVVTGAHARATGTAFIGVFATPMAVGLYLDHGFAPSDLEPLVSVRPGRGAEPPDSQGGG